MRKNNFNTILNAEAEVTSYKFDLVVWFFSPQYYNFNDYSIAFNFDIESLWPHTTVVLPK